MAGLEASEQGEAEILSADYWRKLCPQLHVEDLSYQAWYRPPAVRPGEAQILNDAPHACPAVCGKVRERILEEGFAALQPSELRWAVPVERLAQGVYDLERHGWPPTFIALYDEAWAMARDASEVMRLATGNRFWA